jgi:pimeloyl-ACP methyl ester carboxylesterase
VAVPEFTGQTYAFSVQASRAACGVEPDRDDVPNLDRVERLPDGSHWVHHDEHERVTQLLIDFFTPALPARNT